MIHSVHPYSPVGVDGTTLERVHRHSLARPPDPQVRRRAAGLRSLRKGTALAGDIPIVVVGNLVADPELKFTPSGAAVVNFTVASTARKFDRETNTWKDGDKVFMRCNAWRGLAENVAESFTKGMRVMASGVLRQRSYETKEGEKRSVMELEAEEVGPSLKYATAAVNKISRSGSSETGGNSGGNKAAADPWTTGGGAADPWGSSSGEPPY